MSDVFEMVAAALNARCWSRWASDRRWEAVAQFLLKIPNCTDYGYDRAENIVVCWWNAECELADSGEFVAMWCADQHGQPCWCDSRGRMLTIGVGADNRY